MPMHVGFGVFIYRVWQLPKCVFLFSQEQPLVEVCTLQETPSTQLDTLRVVLGVVTCILLESWWGSIALENLL